MFEDIVNKKIQYDRQFRAARAQLERDKINNEKIDQYREDLDTLRALHTKVSEYLGALRIVETAVTKEARDYQNRRIDNLNVIITDAINKIFPNKHMVAELSADFSRTDTVSLKLYDEWGNDFSPYICEGKLMQYLISVAAVAAITKSLNISNMFIDEAFGVSRIDHLEDLGDLLQSFVDDGLQTVIISQNPALYNNLSRHEVRLETVDGDNETYARVTEEVDV